MVVYPGLKKAETRMGKICKLVHDKAGIVRTFKVKLRPRDKRTDGKVRYLARP